MITVNSDYKKFLKQIGWLVLISAAISIIFGRDVDNTSTAALFFSTCVVALLLYPIIFLSSWLQSPPKSLFIRSFVHIITLSSIVYYLVLGLFLTQYLYESLSYDSVSMTAVIFGVSIYLIYRYTQFVRKAT